jgi:hypothetical protein
MIKLGPQPDRSNQELVTVHDAVVTPEFLAGLYSQLLKAPPGPPGGGYFFTKLQTVREFQRGNKDPARGLEKYLGEFAHTLFTYLAVVAEKVPAVPEDAFIDFWYRTDTLDGGQIVYPHFDTSAEWPGSPHDIPSPLWSTVLHAGPATDVQGGSTFIAEELPPLGEEIPFVYNRMPLDMALTLSSKWREVPFAPGRLTLFNGSLLHFAGPVLGLPSMEEPRAAVAVNFHTRMPAGLTLHEGCSFLTVEEFKVLNQLALSSALAMLDVAKHLEASQVQVLHGMLERTQAFYKKHRG